MWRLPYTVVRNIIILPGVIKKMRQLAAAEPYNEEEAYRYTQYVIGLMQKTGGIRTKGFGMENLPKEGGYMLYPNHQGKYDAYGIVATHEFPCSVVMDEAKSHVIFIRELVDVIRGKRMNISDTRQALTIINEMTKEVQEGRRFILFPQGGYTEDQKNTMGEFRPGCFKISLKSKTPIVPVVLWDSYKVYNTWQLRPVTTEVHYLPPIPYEEFAGLKTHEISAMVKLRIQEKLDELAKERTI